MPFTRRLRPIAAAAILAALPLAVAAGPFDPVAVEIPPADADPIFSPGVRMIADLPDPYVEEEFFVSGQANVYTYEDPIEPKPDALVPLIEDMPWKTRIIVRRPANAEDFNGTVVVEWWNSTAGFDTAPVWDPSAEYFTREGVIYVGVTNSDVSIGHLLAGCSIFPPVLPTTCGTRYADANLDLPENGVAYEMISQIANLLKSDESHNPIPSEYGVRRIYHSGQSQQGGSMITYASSFHNEVNDGYFVQGARNARSINSVYPSCDAAGPPLPDWDCTPRLQGDDRLVRTDLPVPVYRAVTETDVAFALGSDARQRDEGKFRYYEITGATHLTVHTGVEIIPGLLDLEDACKFEMNSLADGPVFGSHIYNAMWENMQQTSRERIAPPHGENIATGLDTNDALVILRDDHGNALGGIRPPGLDVPVASYAPNNTVADSIPGPLQPLLGLACILAGSVFDFDQATLDHLYPTHESYVEKVAGSTYELEEQRFMLPEDAEAVRATAEASMIGADLRCGLGFEAALAIPIALLVRGARRRRSRG